MKTHYKKIKNTNYIGSWDLLDKNGNVIDKTVTITKATQEMVHDGRGGKENCATIHFKECKPMVANATNLKVIASLAASNFIEDWVGMRITLTVRQVKAFGEMHDAIRVKENTIKPSMQDAALPEAIKFVKGGGDINAIKNKYELTESQLKQLQDA